MSRFLLEEPIRKLIGKRLLLLTILLFASLFVWAQITVTGHVSDIQTQHPVSNALIKAGNFRVFSDDEGNFSITFPESETMLSVSASFYQPQEFAITGSTNFNIQLAPEEQNIEAVTVSALRIESRLLNSTGPVSLITGAQLARNSPVAIESSLNQVPGIFMHSGSYNTNRITIRGIGSRSPYGTSKIKAYLDEIPLTSGDGETTLEDVSLNAISQVEVVRGPTSGVYGSGLGGAILLKSMPGTEALKVQTNFMAGSYGTHKEGISLTANPEKSSHLLVADFLYSDGYRENNQYNRSNLFSYNRFDIGEKGNLSVLFDFVDLKAYIPSSIDFETYKNDPHKAAANWANAKGNEDVRKIRGALTYRHSYSANSVLSLTALLSHSTNLELRPFNLLQEEALTGSGRITWAYKTHSMEGVAGTEFFREVYDWGTYKNKEVATENRLSLNQEIRMWNNLFLLNKWHATDGFSVEGGVNLNLTQYDYDDLFTTDGDASGTRKFPALVSPRLGFNWQYSGQSAVYGLISHGFSAPSLPETLQPDGKVNPEIMPETGWNIEFGARGKLFGNRLFYDLSVYRMLIKNLLVARRTGEDEFVGVNAGKTTHDGIEADLRYFGRFGSKVHWTWFANSTFARHRFDEFVDLENNYSGNKLTGVPSAIVNSGWELRSNNGWVTSLNFRHVATLPLNDGNTLFSEPHQLFNWRAGKQFQFLDLGWKITGGINNLFNTHYASMYLINAPKVGPAQPRYYYPGLPRNYNVTVQIQFVN